MSLEYLCDNQRHIVCRPYSVQNLHVMARDLGLKKHWFHGGKYPHYDMPVHRRTQIMARCMLVSPREILRTIQEGLKDG